MISGKRITSLYNITEAQEIDVKDILNAGFIKEFDERHRDYIPGYASDCLYEYTSGTDYSFEIFIDGRNFILHIKESSAYFIGNVQKNTICFYNHRDSAHFKYRITGCVKEGKRVSDFPADVCLKMKGQEPDNFCLKNKPGG